VKIRKSNKIVTFKKPFTLYGFKGTLPAGHYEVEIEEQWIEGLSFLAFKRKQVKLHLQVDPKHPGVQEALILSDPKELDAALRRDAEKAGTATKSPKQAAFPERHKKAHEGSKPIQLPYDHTAVTGRDPSLTWPSYH